MDRNAEDGRAGCNQLQARAPRVLADSVVALAASTRPWLCKILIKDWGGGETPPDKGEHWSVANWEGIASAEWKYPGVVESRVKYLAEAMTLCTLAPNYNCRVGRCGYAPWSAVRLQALLAHY